ncbi:MAG: response regulator [Myxococcales bacterium]|nr:response regulator [Myxococcales bacterium]
MTAREGHGDGGEAHVAAGSPATGPARPEPDFRALFEAAPGAYLVLSPELRIVAVTDAYLRATMTDRERLLGRGLFEIFPDNPDDPAATGVSNLRASLARVLADGRADTMAVQKYDIRRPAAEGGSFEVRYWSPVNSPVLGADGRVAYVIHRVEDVSDFVRAETRGAEQTRLVEDLRTRTGEMASELYHRAQEIQDANRQLRALQGELEARVAARTAELVRANEQLEREAVERQRAEGVLLKTEEQLRQAQKLEAVGRLAGGIAHDFNNLLSIVLSYSDMVLGEVPAGWELRTEVEEIHRAGERAAELTRHLLAFSRQQVLAPKVLDLGEIVRACCRMLGRVLGEDIELHAALAPAIGKVLADPGQIEQVLMNLVVNARDAMPTGGRLTVETADVDIDEGYAAEHAGVEPGPYVMLSVSDTGCGMDRATQARAFEPFFTTKDRSKGTGLGLATVFGIVKQSGGHIWLYSEPGVGTTFKIYLPRHSSEHPSDVLARPRVSRRGTETILLAEDDDQVRAVAQGILKRAGYGVIATASAAEALELCRTPGASFDLLLTDVVMPNMSGRQLAEQVAAVRPGTRVLFMSGYTDDAVLRHGVLEAGVAFIQKPLTPDALGRKVREVLDAVPVPGAP